MSNHNIISTNGTMYYGISTAPSSTPQAVPTKDLIGTRAVEMAEGWIGQVIVGGKIAVESDFFETSREAKRWASDHIIACLWEVFAQ